MSNKRSTPDFWHCHSRSRLTKLCALFALILVSVNASALTAEEEAAENELHRALILSLGATNASATAVGIAADPTTALAAEYTALIANNALKFVPAVFTAPPDRAERPNSGDSCFYEFDLPQSAAKYSNIYFLELPFPEDWGILGQPEVLHNSSEVYVYPNNPFIAEGQTKTQRVFLPAGRHLIEWQADTMFDPWFDLFIPSAAALWNTKKLEANKFKAARAKELAKTRKSQGAFKDALLWVWEKIGGPALKKCVNPAIGDALCAKIAIDSQTQTEQRSATKLRYQTITVYDTRSPIVTIEQPVIELEATDVGGVLKSRVEAQLANSVSVFDPCDRPASVTNSLPELLPLGETTAFWTGRDLGPNLNGSSNSNIKTQRIIVSDTQAPLMIPPAGRVIEIDSGDGLSADAINLGSPRVVDLADPEPTVRNTAPDFFPVDSRTAVSWTATDSSGNAAENTQLITVKTAGTNTAPTVNDLSTTTLTSQPVDVTLTGTDNDELDGRFDPLAFQITDRPDNGEFVAPLLPYFIEDFRSAVGGPYGQPFATSSNQTNWIRDNVCRPELQAGTPANDAIPRDWIHNPKFIHVEDDGTYFMIDAGWRCNTQTSVSQTPRISKWDRNDTFLGEESYGGTSDALVFDQDGLIYTITLSGSGSSASLSLAQRDPAFENPNSAQATDTWTFTSTDGRNDDLGLNDNIDLGQGGYARVDSQRGLLFLNDRRRVFVYDIRDTLSDGISEQYRGVSVRAMYRGTLNNGEQLLCNTGSGGANNVGFAMEVDGDGNLYVTDTCQDRIHRFEPSYLDDNDQLVPGDYVGWLGRCDASSNNACDVEKGRSRGYACTDATCSLNGSTDGDRPGQFDRPLYISLDPNGVLYVADERRVQRFSPDGTFAGEARSTGTGINQGDRPGFVLGNLGEVKAVSVNSTNFFVVDQQESFIHVFETTPLKDITDSSATVTYVSDFAFHSRSDSFSYQASDGLADSNVGTVTVRVDRNFRPPIADDQSLILDEDTPIDITLTGDDPDGVIGTDDVFPLDTLSFEVIEAPRFGELDGSGATWTYTPAANFTGRDSFRFTTNDGRDDSTPATVALTVRSVNDAPAFVETELPGRVAAGFPVVLRTEYTDDGAATGDVYSATVNWGIGQPTEEIGAFVDPDGDGPLPPRLQGLDLSEPIGEKFDRESTAFGKGALFGEHTYSEAGQQYTITQCLSDGETQICDEALVQVERLANLVVNLSSDEQISQSGFIDLDLLVTNQVPEAGVAGLVAENVTLWQVPDADYTVELLSNSGSCQIADGRLVCTAASLQPGASYSARLRITPAGTGPLIYDLELPVAVDVSTTTDSLEDSYNALRWVLFEADTTDTDGDGMTDVFEDTYGLNAGNGSDANADADEDGLSNLEEFEQRTDPTNVDTDSDTIPDNLDSCPLDASGSADFDADGLCEAVRDLSPANRSRMLKLLQLINALEQSAQ